MTEEQTAPQVLAADRAGPRPGGPYVISVWGGKGGIAKTWAAHTIADALGRIAPTLGVDGDKRQTDGGLTEIHGLCHAPTYELYATEEPSEYATLRQLRQFRFVVIDNAPERDDARLRAAADGADLVVVPMPPRALEIRGVMSSIRTILIPMGVRYRVLITAVTVDRRTKAAGMLETMAGLGMPAFSTFVRYYNAHQDAASTGIALVEGDGPNWGKARADVYALVDEVLDVLGEPHRAVRHPADLIGSTR